MYKSMMAQNIIIIIINAAPPRRNGAQRCITKRTDGALHFEGLHFFVFRQDLRFVDFETQNGWRSNYGKRKEENT